VTPSVDEERALERDDDHAVLVEADGADLDDPDVGA
jgi:hypothetical protein